MSDPERFVPPPWIPEAGAWTGANVADRCPGAVLEDGRREPCSGTVMKQRRGYVYRAALCSRCADIETEARNARIAAREAAENETPKRARKLPGR